MTSKEKLHVAAQGQTHDTAQGQLNVTAQGQPHVTSKEKLHVAAQGQTHDTAQGQLNVTAQGQPHMTSKEELHVAAQGQTHDTAQGQLNVTAQGQPHVTSKEKLPVAAQGQTHDKAQGQLNVTAQGQLNVTAQGQPHVTSKEELHVAAQGQTHDTARGQLNVTAQGQPHVTSKEELHVAAQGQTHDTAQGQLNVTAQGQPHVKSKEELHVAVQGQTHDTAQGQLNVTAQGQPHVTSKEELHVAAQGQTHDTAQGQLNDTAKGQPHVTSQEQLHVTALSLDHIEAGTPTVLIRKSLFQATCLGRQQQSTSSSKDHSDSSESDSDINAAIQASLEDSGNPKDILSKMTSQVDSSGIANLINVDRHDVLDGARKGFTRKKFRTECKLNVKFSGEYGIDVGGPSREFMRLALKAIHNSAIFEGDDTAKFIRPDMPSEERGDYYLFGKMIAYFLVHRGPSPNFFSVLMYNLIGDILCQPQISDVVDTEVKQQLQMIKDTEDSRTLTLPETMVQAIEYVGGLPLISQNKRDKLLEVLLEYLVVSRVKAVLAEFVDGISCLGVLRAIRDYPGTMASLFTCKNSPTTAAQVEDMFRPVFAEEGSNQYIQELRTQSHWRDFLQDLEETQGGLKNLLRFVTGLDIAPALGYDPSPQLKFSNPDIGNPHDGTPYANTCANSLTVPVLRNYEIFSEDEYGTTVWDIFHKWVKCRKCNKICLRPKKKEIEFEEN